MNVEPWLRGSLREVDAVRRQVLHALELAEEDVARWCLPLTPEQMWLWPFPKVAPVGFHLRHIALSIERLLTYAEGGALSEVQLAALRGEMEPGPVIEQFTRGIEAGKRRVMQLLPETFEQMRGVGRVGLPSTVGGLLVHVAEHTQRHVGQAITTAKVVAALSGHSATVET